ncbi:MAG: hypothetical protein K2H86_05990 [Muribaculaceae bacterium]|nr:hypothetical protein [Muribaculaceae bacterium]
MKRLLSALFGAALLSASVATADAATVYFDNSSTNWPGVYTWEFGGPGNDKAGTTTQVTIDGHQLYKVETSYAQIIFRGANGWGQGQTDDITIATGGNNAVYSGGQGSTKKIADIVDDKWVAVGGGDQPVDPSDNPMYIRGSFTGSWSNQAEYMFTKGDDGLYTITTTIMAGGSFKVFQGSWAASWGGPADGNNDNTSTLQTIEAGKSYTLLQGESAKNLYVPANLINVTFTFDPATANLTLSDNGQGELPTDYKWWCAWDFNEEPEGASWSFGHEMEEQTEGTYKIMVDCTDSTSANNFFAIFYGKSATGWDDTNNIRYQPKDVDADQVVTQNQTYPMQQGTSYTWKLGKNGQWTVVVDPRDPNNATISFEYGDSTGEANILINDRTETGYDSKSYAMEALPDTDDDDYTWSGTIGKDDEVMFNIHGVTYSYDPSIINSIEEDEANQNLIIQYPLTEGANYVRFDYDIKVTYNVNVTDKTVTLIQTDAPKATINITKANGNTGIHRMIPVEGTTPGTGDSYKTAHLITFEAGDCVDFRLGDKRYIPVFDEVSTQADATAVNFTLAEAPDDEPAPEWKGSNDATPVYVRINENLTGVVQSDIPTAVKGIETEEAEAVYFNLQGIRVANPENGIFIVKKGDKTLKVVK